MIDAVRLPLPESVVTNCCRCGQTHTRKLVVGTGGRCRTGSRSIVVVWRDGYVHTAGRIHGFNGQSGRRVVNSSHRVIAVHYQARSNEATPILSVALPRPKRVSVY